MAKIIKVLNHNALIVHDAQNSRALLLLGKGIGFGRKINERLEAADMAKCSVYELQQNPENYDTSNPDGVASIMVQENLAKTHAVNNVTAIVFDFRGYDTLGESFVLLIAITGATVILRRKRDRWEGGK